MYGRWLSVGAKNVGTLCSTWNVEMVIFTLEWVCRSFISVILIGKSNNFFFYFHLWSLIICTFFSHISVSMFVVKFCRFKKLLLLRLSPSLSLLYELTVLHNIPQAKFVSLLIPILEVVSNF